MLCAANAKCLAFEYGVAYGGAGGYKAGDCQLQSSSNSGGCDGGYHNLDLYTKTGKCKPEKPKAPKKPVVKPDSKFSRYSSVIP